MPVLSIFFGCVVCRHRLDLLPFRPVVLKTHWRSIKYAAAKATVIIRQMCCNLRTIWIYLPPITVSHAMQRGWFQLDVVASNQGRFHPSSGFSPVIRF